MFMFNVSLMEITPNFWKVAQWSRCKSQIPWRTKSTHFYSAQSVSFWSLFFNPSPLIRQYIWNMFWDSTLCCHLLEKRDSSKLRRRGDAEQHHQLWSKAQLYSLTHVILSARPHLKGQMHMENTYKCQTAFMWGCATHPAGTQTQRQHQSQKRRVSCHSWTLHTLG